MARKRRRGSLIYAAFLTVYILALAAAAFYGLGKVWKYAVEYEASRPEKVMDAYIADLSENLWGDSIAQTITEMPHEMQSDADCAQIVKNMLEGGLSYARTGNEDAATITYNLRCDGKVFGKVYLVEDESKAGEVEYGLLPWMIYKEEFDFSGLYSSVSITVPAAYSVELNGNKLGEEYIVESGIHYDVLENSYSKFPDLPTKVTYRFDNIIGTLEPVVYDEDGQLFVIDENKDDSQFIRDADESRLERFHTFAYKFIERYMKYISGVSELETGYDRLMLYVKAGSSLENDMRLAMDGITWAHTSYLTMNSVTLNFALYLGEDVYLLDVTSDVTAGTPRGDENVVQNMKIMVTDIGNDIRASTLDLY